MPVLVTGASGFLGGRLAQVLAERGEAVRVLVRPGSDVRHLRNCKIEFVEGVMTSHAALAGAVAHVSQIYHCAGCSTDWAPWKTYYEGNVTAVRSLLSAAKNTGSVKRFLHVSTTDVYGYPTVPCDESSPLLDAGLPYNQTKLLGEQSVWQAWREHGLPVTVVRPATIYGPRGTAFGDDIAALIRQRLMAVIDNGQVRGGFCYVDNAVGAMIEAANSPVTEGQAYNLADGTDLTWRQYVNALADGLRKPRPWIDLPSSIALALASVLESPHRYLRVPGRPLLTRHAVLLLARDQEYPTEKARAAFGFTPRISWQEGVERTLAYLRLSV